MGYGEALEDVAHIAEIDEAVICDGPVGKDAGDGREDVNRLLLRAEIMMYSYVRLSIDRCTLRTSDIIDVQLRTLRPDRCTARTV